MEVKVCFSSLDREGGGNAVVSDTKYPKFGSCHNLSPLYEEKTPDPEFRIWKYKPTACHPSEYLHGPACLKDSKIVIYSCGERKCIIRCPCKVCRGLQQEYAIVREDFDDHSRYHHAPHLNCQFCNQMLKVLPGLNYKKSRAVSSGKPFPAPSKYVLSTTCLPIVINVSLSIKENL